MSDGGASCNGTRRLEKEDASAQGVLVNSTTICCPVLVCHTPVTAAQWKAFHCVCDLMGDFAKVLPHIEHENVLNQLYHLQQHNARNYEVCVGPLG